MLGKGLRGGACVFVASLTIFIAADRAHAQQQPEFDPAIDLQLFEYATGLHTFLTVPDSDVTADKQFSVDFLITFLTDPFTIYNVDPDGDDFDIASDNPERTRVVESMLVGEVSGAFGFMDDFEVGVALPMVLTMAGEGIDVATAMAGSDLQASGLGDLRAELKWRFWQKDNLRLSALPGITIPTSVGTSPDGDDLGSGDLLGDNLPTLRLRGAVQWTNGKGNLNLGAYAGALFRKPRTVYSSEVGQQLVYGFGGAFKVTDRVDGIAEMFGRSGFNTDLDASPLELNGGVRVQATRAISVLAGGGAGLVRGIGSPGLRMFVSVGWSPDFRDSDGDGIGNDKDKCPLLAEDKDGFEDSDGCPDDDNDGDKREDSIDKCPNEAEDLDGFEDDDGCPEADNDKDGILDADDRCPNDAEDGKAPYDKDGCPADKRDSDDDGTFDAFDQCPDEPEDEDGFEDWDGCPDVDNDGDDIPDEFDECPLCAEDRDGFEDDDGCPDPDNDQDGIADASDKCPDEAEVINGVDDFDGCADSGGVMLVELDGDRVGINGDITFKRRRNTLDNRGEVFVDQLAALALTHPEVTLWRVVVVAPRGKAKTEADHKANSQERADNIKARIVSRGISENHIEAIGAAADTPTIAMVVLERRAADDDGKYCPEGARAVEREQPAEPMPAAPAAAPDASGDASGEASGVPAPDPAVAAALAAADDPDKLLPAEFDEYTGVVAGVTFKRSTSNLLRKSNKTLDKIVGLLEKYPHVSVQIDTHTDGRKGEDKGREITQGQADVLSAYFVEHGIAADRVTATGHGMDEPIGDNKKSSGRKKNRRVEFTFTAK
jgi:outer membrane protein OmpA-like peptidoglycan-associated protein